MLAGSLAVGAVCAAVGDARIRPALDFAGIPAPMAALYWAGLVAIWAAEGAASLDWTVWLGAVGVTLLPLGMVSRWPQFGFKTWGQDRGLTGPGLGG